MNKLLIVGIGGFAGSIARYWVQGAVYKLSGPGFPYGTLAVNVAGSFLIGVVIVLSEERFLLSPELRLLLAVGVLGGFTTFSSFSYETIALVGDAEYFAAFANVAANVFLCLASTWLGTALAKLF